MKSAGVDYSGMEDLSSICKVAGSVRNAQSMHINVTQELEKVGFVLRALFPAVPQLWFKLLAWSCNTKMKTIRAEGLKSRAGFWTWAVTPVLATSRMTTSQRALSPSCAWAASSSNFSF